MLIVGGGGARLTSSIVAQSYTYASSAVVAGGTPAPVAVDDVRVYTPSTRPGA